MFKQTENELNENKAKVDKALLPAVLGDKAWTEIMAPMVKWLVKNCPSPIDASPENMIRALTALRRAGLLLDADWEIPPVKIPEKKEQRYDYAQQSNDGARPNHSKVEKQTEVVRLAANDVNSPVFQQRNAEAKALFEDLCERGPISYRRGRIDRGLTAARREKLVAIRVIAAQLDSEGQQVPIYSKMLEEAQRQVSIFESENSRREQS
jgi:hypothetical protein